VGLAIEGRCIGRGSDLSPTPQARFRLKGVTARDWVSWRSAVAHLGGYAVVLHDAPKPNTTRRGPFAGTATTETQAQRE
jgi:hypothetical protein